MRSLAWSASLLIVLAARPACAQATASDVSIIIPPAITTSTDEKAPPDDLMAGSTVPQAADANDPSTTTEIPPVVPTQSQVDTPDLTAPADNYDPSSDIYNPNNDIYNYQGQSPPAEVQQQLQSLQNFMEDGDNATTIGMVVRDSHRKIDGGGEVAGLLIVNVMPNSPAALAGLRGERSAVHSVIEGATVAAALFFPPAIMVTALVDGTRIGESSDMIIAVDSVRVTNFLDFSNRMRRVQPGEIVYFSVVRDGKRLQVPVKVPGAIPVASSR